MLYFDSMSSTNIWEKNPFLRPCDKKPNAVYKWPVSHRAHWVIKWHFELCISLSEQVRLLILLKVTQSNTGSVRSLFVLRAINSTLLKCTSTKQGIRQNRLLLQAKFYYKIFHWSFSTRNISRLHIELVGTLIIYAVMIGNCREPVLSLQYS